MRKRILVIGGGVTGCSVVWHLATHGVGSVTLLERDKIGSGSTWHSAGNITWRPTDETDTSVLYMFDVIAELERATGIETGWLQTGRLHLARSAKGLAEMAELDEIAKARGFTSALLDPEMAAALHPLLSPETLYGAWHNSLSGRLNPTDLTTAYARAARNLGVDIREDCAVQDIIIKNGCVTGVVTDAGTITADVVVVSAGLWSRDMLDTKDVWLAQWPCEHFYVIADTALPLPRETPSFISPEDLIYGREEVRGMLLGCLDEAALTLDPGALPEPFTFSLLNPNWDKFAPYFEKAIELFPAIEDAPIRQFINGPEAFSADGDPLIGSLDGVEGLYLCSALGSRGVTLSGAAGHTISDLIAGNKPRFRALAAYSPNRFAGRGADTGWLREQVSGAPSHHYSQSNQCDS